MSSHIGGHGDSGRQRLSAQDEPPEAGQIREVYEQPPLTGAPPDQSAYSR